MAPAEADRIRALPAKERKTFGTAGGPRFWLVTARGVTDMIC